MPNKIIPALQSRCLLLRIQLPTKYELLCILQIIAKKQKIKISDSIISIILSMSDRNISKAINTLQIYSLNPTIIFRDRLNVYCSKVIELLLSSSLCYPLIIKLDELLYEIILDNYDLQDLLKKLLEKILQLPNLSKKQTNMLIYLFSNCSENVASENKSMIHIKHLLCQLVILLNKK